MKTVFSFPVSDFSLELTLTCGQCFTYIQQDDGTYSVISARRHTLARQKDDRLILECKANDVEFWKSFFALDMDYDGLKKLIESDDAAARAVASGRGIRVLRQELWEALCCFIISQNNNLKRIGGIVARLCAEFGDEIEPGVFAFPTPQKLAGLTREALAPLRCGFRDRYVLDAAQKLCDGTVDPEFVRTAPLDEAAKMLMRIVGVGEKVAACALLYGAARWEAFPQDVWIKRVMKNLYPDGLPEKLVPVAGIAQQFLFNYARTEM